MMPGLSAAEIERLALLAEECGEVVQVVGKVLRHGYASTHPEGGADNRALLTRELGDLQAAMSLLTEYGDVRPSEIVNAAANKWSRMQQYLHHQEAPRDR